MEFLSRFSIACRSALIGVIALVGILLLSIDSIFVVQSTLMNEKSVQTQGLVESAHSVIKHYHDRFQAGELTEEQAQDQAKNTLQALRYADNNYVWINDLSPKMVMHPIKPALNGKDLSQIEDANGKRLFVAFADMVKANGAGNVDYYWAKPGSDIPVPKISYVKGFKPWGWIIGTGIYIDDVDATLWETSIKMHQWPVK